MKADARTTCAGLVGPCWRRSSRFHGDGAGHGAWLEASAARTCALGSARAPPDREGRPSPGYKFTVTPPPPPPASGCALGAGTRVTGTRPAGVTVPHLLYSRKLSGFASTCPTGASPRAGVGHVPCVPGPAPPQDRGAAAPASGASRWSRTIGAFRSRGIPGLRAECGEETAHSQPVPAVMSPEAGDRPWSLPVLVLQVADEPGGQRQRVHQPQPALAHGLAHP